VVDKDHPYEISGSEEVFGSTLSVMHSCGHVVSYWYARPSFARNDVRGYMTKPCINCECITYVARNVKVVKLTELIKGK